MGKTTITEDLFPEIVKEYNNEGKTAAYGLLRSRYGVKNPYSVMTRIKCCGKYGYDPDNDRFSCPDEGSSEQIFMDLDELCTTPALSTVKNTNKVEDTRQEAMERLVRELISDRLLALSRYINMDTSTKTILIDQSSLSADGYKIITH